MTFVKFMIWSLDTCQLAFDLKILLPYLLFSVLICCSFNVSSLFLSCSGLTALRRAGIKAEIRYFQVLEHDCSSSTVTPVNRASLGNVTQRIDNYFYKGLKHFSLMKSQVEYLRFLALHNLAIVQYHMVVITTGYDHSLLLWLQVNQDVRISYEHF